MTIDKDIAFRLGRPLSPLYGLLMKLRAAAYRRGWLISEQLEVPVVSVGNLTMGGTGKTPMVMALARQLRSLGRRPAVVSRGYGGKSRKPVNLVSDGSRLLMDVAEAGDEPRLLAESLPGVVVATGVRRSLVCRFVIRELGVDFIILDDGFQHLGVRRDLDLVLFKGPDFMGNGRVFPGGDLREPVSSLSRAGAFAMTGTEEDLSVTADEFRAWLQGSFPGRPVYSLPYEAGDLQPANLAGRENTDRSKLLAFCGLARPEPFRQMLMAQGYELCGFHIFPDHHPYNAADLAGLTREARKCGAALVTTAKDLVKLGYLGCNVPLYVLPVELELPESLADLIRQLL